MFKKTDDLVQEVTPKECSLPACLSTPFPTLALLVVTLIKRKPPPDAYSAPAHYLATIIMKFLLRLYVHIFLSPVCTLLSPVLNISCMLLLIWLLLALVVIAAAVDVFVLPPPAPPASFIDQFLDGLRLQPVQLPGVPAVFASPPMKRERGQTENQKVVEN